MIVTCDECSTSFQLDESRIPAAGARVRCSKCKHAFFLPNPTASATDAVHSIAEEAAQDGAAGVPPASSDLAGLDGSIASEANPAAPEPDADEDDWEFTEEIRIEGDEDLDVDSDFGVETDFTEGFDESAVSADVSDSDDAGESGLELDGPDLDAGNEPDLSIDADDGSGLDLGSPPGPGSEDDLASEGIEAGHDVTSFGAVEDFSELTEDIETESVDIESSDIPDLREEPGADAGLYSAAGSTDDLGEPESWDLAPGADFDSPKASIAGLVDSFGSTGSDSASASGSSPFGADFAPSAFDADLEGSSVLKDRLALLGSAIGWVITIAAVAIVGYLSVQSEWTRWESATQVFTDGAFAAETSKARWVETTRSGTLFVVDGVARNTSRERIVPVPLGIAMLDAEGNQLPGDAMPVGLPLAEKILREGTPAELNQAILESLRYVRSAPLGPGESRAFQLVLAELPEGAKRFALTGIEPSRVLATATEALAIEPVVERLDVDPASLEAAIPSEAPSVPSADPSAGLVE